MRCPFLIHNRDVDAAFSSQLSLNLITPLEDSLRWIIAITTLYQYNVMARVVNDVTLTLFVPVAQRMTLAACA